MKEGHSEEETQVAAYVAEEVSEGELDILPCLVDLAWCVDGDTRVDSVRMFCFTQRISLYRAKPGD